MICHWHLADRLSFMDLTAVSLSLFLIDCRIKSTGTLTYPKASFGPALELSKSPRPRVFTSTLSSRIKPYRRFLSSLTKLCPCLSNHLSLPATTLPRCVSLGNIIRHRRHQSPATGAQVPSSIPPLCCSAEGRDGLRWEEKDERRKRKRKLTCGPINSIF